MGKFFFTMLAAFAEMEREQIRQRTSDAMRHHQARGRRVTTAERCPYGKHSQNQTTRTGLLTIPMNWQLSSASSNCDST